MSFVTFGRSALEMPWISAPKIFSFPQRWEPMKPPAPVTRTLFFAIVTWSGIVARFRQVLISISSPAFVRAVAAWKIAVKLIPDLSVMSSRL